jgi:hypothetical protein
MARQRERVCLEQGLRLDLVQLARRGFIRFGANVGPRGIQWNDKMSEEVFASGIITADMSGSEFGWLQINMEDFQQCVAYGLPPFLCSHFARFPSPF